MGGGLGFLNKKTWHPGRMSNQEALWKAEEKAAKEQREVEELRKQYAAEREREELREVAVAGGHLKPDERLDWMYGGGMVAQMDAEKRSEQALLGERLPDANDQPVEPTRLEQATQLPSFYAEDSVTAANETWARLHADPLFAMKQQELAARKRIIKNPVLMAAVRQEAESIKAQKAAKKAAKKEAKAAKKDAKTSKKSKKRDIEDAAPDLAVVASGPSAKRHRASRSRSPARTGAGGDSQADLRAPQNGNAHPRHADAGHNGSRNGHRLHDDRRLHEARRRDEAERRDRSGRDSDRHHHRNGDAGGRRDGNERADMNGRSRDSDRQDSDRHREHRSGDRHEEDSRHRERHAQENGHGKTHRSADDDRRPLHGEPAAPREATVYRGGGVSAQGADARYGLSYGADGEGRFGDRSEAAEATRRRLEAAAAAKEAEEREAAAARATRRAPHKVGGLSAEEKAARLAEMQSNAEAHETDRLARLRRAEERDAAEDGAPSGARHHSETAGFMEVATKQVYGTASGGGSMAERVGRRKFFNDRTGSDNAFRR